MSSISDSLGLVRVTSRQARRVAIVGAVASALVAGVACQPTSGYFAMASRPQLRRTEASSAVLGSGAAPARVVKVELSEWKISLASDSVSAGPVTLRVHNVGTMAHAFEVEGNGLEKRTAPIPIDSTIALTVDLKPGKYEIYCPLAGGSHKKMGMETDLAVRSGE
jgi:plastocyanin